MGDFASPEAGGDATAYSLTETADKETWGGNDVIGIYMTKAGAAVLHSRKKIHMILHGSHGPEVIATSKAVDAISYAEGLERADVEAAFTKAWKS